MPFATKPIYPEVPNGSDILNIGEASGAEEQRLGRPFVGSSGALLRRWLGLEGLLERSAFANVELHQPFDAVCKACKVEYWQYADLVARKDAEARRQSEAEARASRAAAKGREVKPYEPLKTNRTKLAAWEHALECEHVWKAVRFNRDPRDPKSGECCGLSIIAKLLANPRWKIVLFWGGVGARVAGGYSGSVGSMVGRFRTLSTGQTGTVLYHPAYALRQRGTPEYAATESHIREVLRQVSDRLEHPDTGGTYPYTWVSDWPTFRIKDPAAVVDIETNVAKKDPDPRIDSPKTLCLGSMENNDVILHKLQDNYRLLLPREGTKLVMHNAQYDLPIVMRLSGRTDIDADDTMVQAYLLGEKSLSLKILGRRLLGLPAREYLETGGDDAEYAAQDPHLTRELKRYFDPRISAKGMRFLYEDIKTPVQRISARHTIEGLKIDHARLDKVEQSMVAKVESLRKRLIYLAGREFNPASNDECARIIYDEIGLPPDRKLGRTTNETVIGEFRHVPFVSTLLAWRKANSFRTRYTVPLSRLVRVSGQYNLTGTGTDRVSQSDRNCMNFPGMIKACIEADEGGYFVYGDFSQIELRLAAYFSQDQYLLGVIREGRNMHEEMAIAVYGVRTPDTYTQAKSSNFARLFGAGKKKRAKTLKMPISVVNRLEIPWPGWDAWVERRRLEPARTYFGYERQLSDAVESADEYIRDKANRQIINSIIQGTAGEINQYAEVLGDKYLSQLDKRAKVIHQEHDSVLGWVPNSVPRELAKEALAAAMKAAGPQEIQDVIEIKAKVITGDHWQ